MCITSIVSEVLSVKSDDITILSISRYDNSVHEVSKADKDGILLLFYAMVPSKMTNYNMQFEEGFANKIKKVKDNTIRKATDHHHGQGSYYSLGNNGEIELVNNSSVDQ